MLLDDGIQPESDSACATLFPSLMIPIFSNALALMVQTSETFLLGQGPDQDDYCDCLVSFHVPDVSVGCQLEFDLPNGFQGSWGPPEKIYVWNVTGPFDSECSWNDAPDSADLLGSVVLHNNITRAIVNSFVCQSNLSFRIGMDSSGQAGNCSFEQMTSSGLMLRYSC